MATATTTIRVDTATRDKLLELSHDNNVTLIEIVRQAADELSKKFFARNVVAQLEKLRADPVAWQDYLDEAEETYVSDGIC
jgi:hypothetical protein